LNWYRGFGGNPITFVDPTGLDGTAIPFGPSSFGGPLLPSPFASPLHRPLYEGWTAPARLTVAFLDGEDCKAGLRTGALTFNFMIFRTGSVRVQYDAICRQIDIRSDLTLAEKKALRSAVTDEFYARQTPIGQAVSDLVNAARQAGKEVTPSMMNPAKTNELWTAVGRRFAIYGRIAIALTVAVDVADIVMTEPDEREQKIVEDSVSLAGSWTGAEAGAIAGGMYFGPIGAVIGGIIGAIGGGAYGSWLANMWATFPKSALPYAPPTFVSPWLAPPGSSPMGP